MYSIPLAIKAIQLVPKKKQQALLFNLGPIKDLTLSLQSHKRRERHLVH